MLMEIGKYKLDIDIEKTRHFYEKAAAVSETCSCDGCQNFGKAVDTLPDMVREFFSNLGIDLRKMCECYVLGVNENGTLLYGGFSHICGKLLKGECSRQQADNDGPVFYITPDFSVSFREETDLLEPDFPAPVIQLEFSADIPWVLDKDNSYL